MKPVRQNVRQAREAHKLTQRDVAERLGISLRAYQRYEHGESILRPQRLIQLAEMLELSIDDVLLHHSTRSNETA
ncbi:helix-turn-helix domain-containing protein [Alicyclobacillus sendaiensis]|uniref:helix-turn-helix domain-containing protein n=1 Tax=Alicyclobacillus sendaiensis TaxID=192387 RepID=UPI00350E363C